MARASGIRSWPNQKRRIPYMDPQLENLLFRSSIARISGAEERGSGEIDEV